MTSTSVRCTIETVLCVILSGIGGAVAMEPACRPTSQSNYEDQSLVIVPCLNEEAHLTELLTTLLDDPACGKIVVVDGGSTDGSKAIVAEVMKRDDRVTLLNNPKRIQAAGINLAIEAYGTGFEWMTRVDAHCQYPARYISSLRDAAARTGADCVVVPMVTRSRSGCFQTAVAAAQNSVLGTGGSAHRHVSRGAFVAHGHHALMRVATFLTAGRYDERFRANEDAELDLRITAEGGRIWLEPSAAIIYYPRDTPWGLLLQYFRYGRGRAMTFLHHRPRLHLRQLLPLAVLPSLLLAVLAPCLTPENGALSAPAAAWIIAAIAFGAFLGLRERSRCAAAAGIAAIIMHASWSTGFWFECVRSSLRRASSVNGSAAQT